MKSATIKILCFIILSVALTKLAYAWGFWGHKRINHMAVFTLPSEMFGFYKKHIDFLTEHAIDPDKRRYSDVKEAPRHYIDADHYGEHPFDSLPRYWKNAVEKYTEDTLQAYGIVPWHINVMMNRLTDAFMNKDVDRIIYLSANIGHYIADAHVPLHCTENYNGQFTNQHGIHGFWESRVPELFGENYDYFTGRAEYLENAQLKAWDICKASYAALDSVLLFERKLNTKMGDDRKYAFEQRGSATQKVYSKEYTQAYSNMLDGMVERRMREAILSVGSFWYTAWVDAGKPDLDLLGAKPLSEKLKKQVAEEEQAEQEGKVKAPKGHDENEAK